MASTFEERARARGFSDQSTARTRELVEAIGKILRDEDVSPFQAPELSYPKEVRLARLFIDRHAKLQTALQAIVAVEESFNDRQSLVAQLEEIARIAQQALR